MNVHPKGLKVKDLIKALKSVNPDAQVLIASDEEHNIVFKGMCFEYYGSELIIAGLSGCEVDE